MAKKKQAGDNRRVGAIKGRTQVKNSLTDTWTKRDTATGQFLDVKADAKPFKGVRKETLQSANSMGVVIVDPAVRPSQISVTKIRSAISSVTKKS